MFEAFAEAHSLVEGVADLSVELSCGLVRVPDLEVDFRAPETAESCLCLVHEQTTESLTPMSRVDREVIDPAPVAFVADHHRPDQLAVLLEYEEVLGVPGQLTVDVAVRIVPRSRQLADRPERHERLAVGRPVRPEYGFHGNCLPARISVPKENQWDPGPVPAPTQGLY